jgi:hypothetical protein
MVSTLTIKIIEKYTKNPYVVLNCAFKVKILSMRLEI